MKILSSFALFSLLINYSTKGQCVDLDITGFPQFNLNGQSFSTSTVVQNLGSCASEATTLSIYLSTTQNQGEYLITRIEIPVLAALATYNIPTTVFDMSLLQAPEANNYYIVYILDEEDLIEETLSNNNLLSLGGNVYYQGSLNTSDNITPSNSKSKIEINAYPNPFAKEIYIKIEHTSKQPLTYSMKDITGKVLAEFSNNQEINKIETANFSEGVYFLSISQNNVTLEVKRIIKSRETF